MRSLCWDVSEACLCRRWSKCRPYAPASGPSRASPGCICGLAVFSMNDSSVLGKHTPAPWATSATALRAAWGCPPGRRVCSSCRPGDCGFAFLCTRERGEQPVSSSSCCENSVGKPERSFHSRTQPGKHPPNWQTFLNERPSGLKHSPAGQNPDDGKNIMRRVVV